MNVLLDGLNILCLKFFMGVVVGCSYLHALLKLNSKAFEIGLNDVFVVDDNFFPSFFYYIIFDLIDDGIFLYIFSELIPFNHSNYFL